MFRLTTPVVFCTFNRMEQAKTVFKQIRKAKPQKLYLVSDGARINVPEESNIVAQIRANLENSIDWECEIVKLYASENMGCGRRISSALDKVFELEESAIILEDDCLPVDSFFEYCQTMLELYKDDERVASIAGGPTIEYKPIENVDYYFSSIFFCWGWATWGKIWKDYDYNIKSYGNNKRNIVFKEVLNTKGSYWYLMSQFDVLYKQKNKFTWDFQFWYMTIINRKYVIIPKCNLTVNLGFCNNSTHTAKKPDYYYDKTEEITFPIKRNNNVCRNIDFDKFYFKKALKHGWIVRLKLLLGLDINKAYIKE